MSFWFSQDELGDDGDDEDERDENDEDDDFLFLFAFSIIFLDFDLLVFLVWAFNFSVSLHELFKDGDDCNDVDSDDAEDDKSSLLLESFFESVSDSSVSL